MKRYDVFLTDGHRLTTNEDGYQAVLAGFSATLIGRLVRLTTVRGDRLGHSLQINVDQVVTISVDEESL